MSNQKNRALGRGLEQLFNTEKIDMKSLDRIEKDFSSDEIVQINLKDLRPNPYQPRKNFEEKALNELADSIKEHGVFQPIIVKKSVKGFEIIAGERRYRAAKIAGLDAIPAVIRELTDQQMMEIALLENLQREDLSAIEEALAYNSLLEKLKLTQDELAKRVGKSRSHITNILGLLRLPKDVQAIVIQGDLTMGHARVLSKLTDVNKIRELATLIIEEGISVRQLENLMQENKHTDNKKDKTKKSVDDSYKYVENILKERFVTNVKIDEKKIVINYSSVEDLNRILELMGAIEE